MSNNLELTPDSGVSLSNCHGFVSNLLYNERLASFGTTWPYTKESEKCTPKNLAMAGLVFISHTNVRCFVCGCTIRNLQPNSDPWMQHKTVSPSCVLIQMGYPEHPDAYTIVQVYELLQAAMSHNMDEDFRELDTGLKVILENLNKENKKELSFFSDSDSSMDF